MKLLALFAIIAAIPASATTVYFEGTLNTGGSASGGSFYGSFDIGFPVGTAFELLSTYDVFVKQGSTIVEMKNGQSGTYGEVFAQYEAQEGGLNIQFIDTARDSLNLYFTVPFTGNAPLLIHTPTGYASSAGIANGATTAAKTGVASLTPLPEPGTWLLTAAGALVLIAAKKKLAL